MFSLLAVNGQDLIAGLQAAAIGIVLVFVILGILILIVYGSKYLVIFMDKKVKPHFANKKAMKSGVVENSNDDDGITAAIVAAVTMMYEQEALEQGTEPIPFVIKEIKYMK